MKEYGNIYNHLLKYQGMCHDRIICSCRKNFMKLSEKMIKAGWVVHRDNNGSFTVFGSEMQEYRYDSSTENWSEDLATIEHLLEQDLAENASGKNSPGKSPFVISSRLTALNHRKQISQPVRYLCQKGLVSDKSVLHLGTGMDRFAREALIKAGCRNVKDYDPNFFPDTSVLDSQYDIVMAHYVLNILPPKERKQVYRLIAATLKENGVAYLTVQGLWPVEHKYDIIRPLDDGYLIRTGYNSTFRKGYSPEELLKEIKSELGGTARIMTEFYNNSLASWTKEEIIV